MEALGAAPDPKADLAGFLVHQNQVNSLKNDFLDNQIEAREQTERRTTMINAAKSEIESIKQSYQKQNPDFDAAFKYGEAEYTRALKALFPKFSASQIKAAFDTEVLNLGIKASREGTNLGEVLYDLAIDRFGYQPNGDGGQRQQTGGGDRRPGKPNLRVISGNQKRSASPLDGGGRSGGSRITLEQAADMSLGELMSLSEEDTAYLHSQGF